MTGPRPTGPHNLSQRRIAKSVAAVIFGVLLLATGSALTQGDEGSTDESPPADPSLENLAGEHEGDEPVANDAATTQPTVPVTTEEVVYGEVGGESVTGYLARPEGHEGPLPGLVVIHEWWGLNDNIRMMTERLAGEGYVALAIDLYGGVVAETPEDAMSTMQAATGDQESLQANLGAAVQYVTSQTGGAPVGSIGWCFGGAMSLQTAIHFPDAVSATVIYYGQLVTDREALAAINHPMLGIFGALDSHITPEHVREFGGILEELGKNWEVHIYPEADHAFANPSGTRYEPEAAALAWQETTEFLDANLRPAAGSED